MKPKATLIDYGIGNLLSVSRAFEHCGADVSIAKTVEQLADAERLILPGVGAFADGMAGLRERGFIEPILKHVSSGKPLLGICLGMQMLLDESEEFGNHPGLGIIPGKVKAIPGTTLDNRPHKIPHIGWGELLRSQPSTSWQDTVMDGIEERGKAYFVHSFTAVPTFDEHRLVDTDYNGRAISAVIRKGSVYGTQFHPEKSRQLGLEIIENFMRLT